MVFLNELLIITVTICVLLYTYGLITFKYWKKRNFPYLKPRFPISKHNRLLKVSKNFGVEILEYYDEMKERRLKFAGIFSGLRPVLVVNDPDYIKDILVKDFNYFIDRGFFHNEKAEPITTHLFSVDETQWKPLRVKLTPTFTSGKMKMMFQSLVAYSETLVKAINKCVEDRVDFNSKDFLANFTTDVIGSCAFGLEMNSFDKDQAKFREAGRKIMNVTSWKLMFNLTLMASIPGLAKALGLLSIDKNVAEFLTTLITATVQYRETNKIQRPDFLQLLIDLKNKEKTLTMNQIVSQVFLFFVAGFDTSSSAMNFALYELAQHADKQEKLRSEIIEVLARNNNEITYENIKEMAYLQQVLDETLRLYPSLVNLQRVCTKDYQLRDTNLIIEKGTPIVIPIIGLHRDADYYTNPLQFDPDRFSAENKSKLHEFVHLPFGEGPRNCIGLRFGVMQSKIGLIQILRNFRISISPRTQMPLTFKKTTFLIQTNETLYLNAERIN